MEYYFEGCEVMVWKDGVENVQFGDLYLPQSPAPDDADGYIFLPTLRTAADACKACAIEKDSERCLRFHCDNEGKEKLNLIRQTARALTLGNDSFYYDEETEEKLPNFGDELWCDYFETLEELQEASKSGDPNRYNNATFELHKRIRGKADDLHFLYERFSDETQYVFNALQTVGSKSVSSTKKKQKKAPSKPEPSKPEPPKPDKRALWETALSQLTTDLAEQEKVLAVHQEATKKTRKSLEKLRGKINLLLVQGSANFQPDEPLFDMLCEGEEDDE